MRLVGELEVDVLLEELCPRVRKIGSEKNDVRVFEISHVQLTCIAHDQLTVVCLRKTREPHRRIQICNIGVTLGIQVSHVLRVNVVGALER